MPRARLPSVAHPMSRPRIVHPTTGERSPTVQQQLDAAKARVQAIRGEPANETEQRPPSLLEEIRSLLTESLHRQAAIESSVTKIAHRIERIETRLYPAAQEAAPVKEVVKEWSASVTPGTHPFSDDQGDVIVEGSSVETVEVPEEPDLPDAG